MRTVNTVEPVVDVEVKDNVRAPAGPETMEITAAGSLTMPSSEEVTEVVRLPVPAETKNEITWAAETYISTLGMAETAGTSMRWRN